MPKDLICEFESTVLLCLIAVNINLALHHMLKQTEINIPSSFKIPQDDKSH